MQRDPDPRRHSGKAKVNSFTNSRKLDALRQLASGVSQILGAIALDDKVSRFASHTIMSRLECLVNTVA